VTRGDAAVKSLLAVASILLLGASVSTLSGCKSGGTAAGGMGGATATGGQGGQGGQAGQGGPGGGGGRRPLTGTFPTQTCLDMADGLIAQMTLDEEVAQIMQLERLEVSPAQVGQYGIGLLYSQGGSAPLDNSPSGWADMTDGFRQGALTSRLQIPVIYGIDIVHGVGPVKGATVFPHNIGLGASRDIALVEQIGRVTAQESAGCGLDFPFSPVVAVARDERWGRTYESYGEAPELAESLGAAAIRGFEQLPPGDGSASAILASAARSLSPESAAVLISCSAPDISPASIRADPRR